MENYVKICLENSRLNLQRESDHLLEIGIGGAYLSASMGSRKKLIYPNRISLIFFPLREEPNPALCAIVRRLAQRPNLHYKASI